MNNAENKFFRCFMDDGSLVIIPFDGQELYDLIRKYSTGIGHLGFNRAEISYCTGNGSPMPEVKKGLILYGLPKDKAIEWTNTLNLEHFIFKDNGFIGIVNADGSVNKELEIPGKGYNISGLDFGLMITVIYPIGMVKNPKEVKPQSESVTLFNKQTD